MQNFAVFYMLNRLILQFCDYRQFLGNKNTLARELQKYRKIDWCLVNATLLFSV